MRGEDISRARVCPLQLEAAYAANKGGTTEPPPSFGRGGFFVAGKGDVYALWRMFGQRDGRPGQAGRPH